MRCLPSLLLATLLLSGCASQTQDPSGIWINQAAIDAANLDALSREVRAARGVAQGRGLLAINPATRAAIDTPVFNCASANLVKQACELADQAFDSLRSTSPSGKRPVISILVPSSASIAQTD